MFVKLFSLLIVSIILLIQPFYGPGQRDPAHSSQNSPAAGSGFFQYETLKDNEPVFLLRGLQGTLWLTGNAIWLTFWEAMPAKSKGEDEKVKDRRGVHLKFTFPGANPQPFITPEQALPGHVSILKGQNQSAWSTNLPLWAQLRYHDLYPGVDLVIQSTSTGFVWAYEAQAGVDVSRLRLQVQGAEGLQEGASGWVARTAVGELRLPPLLLSGGVLSPDRDAQKPSPKEIGGMEIYPVAGGSHSNATVSSSGLAYCTYLGGGEWDTANDVAVDASGAAYLVGVTASLNFPTTPGAFDLSIDQTDVFAVKLMPHSGGLTYATFLGGDSQETGWSLAVENGIAYIGGETSSANFPVTDGTNIYAGEGDAFVVALNPTGTGLVYSRLLGGEDQDRGYGIAVENGSAYLTGITYSSGFPGGGYYANGDVFAAKLNSGGTLNYSLVTGGNQVDAGFGIAVRNGIAWLTGETWSGNFTNELKGEDDVFIMSLTTSGSVASKRTYGGAEEEEGINILLDTTGNVFITGTTKSTDFPFSEGTLNGQEDAYLLKVNPSNDLVLYATSLGGSGIDRGKDLAIDTLGNVVVAGSTQSANFPITPDAYQPIYGGGGDIFITRYDLSGSDPGHRSYSSFLGGSGYDVPNGLAMDSSVFAYLAGQTQSTNFPTTPDGLFRVLNGTQDAFFSVMAVGPVPTISILKTTNNQAAGQPPGPYILAGNPVTWRYDVTNTSEVTLTNVTVTDDHVPAVACPKTSLDLGESMQCSASGLAIKGQYANLGTVSALTPYGTSIWSMDSSYYFGADPKITLFKKTNGTDANTPPGVYLEVGSEVQWSYEVANSGNVDLTDVTVVDDNGTPSNPSDDVTVCSIPLLAAGATDTSSCHMAGTAKAGQYTNIAVATGIAPGALGNVTASHASNYFGSAPAITLVKKINDVHVTAGPVPYLLAGSPITWKYELHNTGNVTLTNVSVIDDNGTSGSSLDDRVVCSGITLNAGTSTTCVLAGTALAGPYANIATVSATPPVGPAVTAQDDSYYFGAMLDVSLQKQTNGLDAETEPGPLLVVGAPVSWSYQVTNNGNVAVDISIVDDNGTPAIPTDDAVFCNYHLEPDTSQICARDGIASAGQYANTATLTATPPGGLNPLIVQDNSHYFGVVTGVDIIKYTNGQDANEIPGPYIHISDPVLWTYVVTNSGNVPLSEVVVTDNKGVTVTCPGTSLEPAAQMTCTASGKAASGQYENIGTVTANPPDGFNPVTDSDPSHYFGGHGGVTIEKFTNNLDVTAPPGPVIRIGQPVAWKYVVENTGNVTLNNIAVTDDKGVTVICPLMTLGSKDQMECTASGVAIPGQYMNTGTVSAQPVGESVNVQASDVSYYLGADPSIQIVKKTNGQDANGQPGIYIRVGSKVDWTYELTNSSQWDFTQLTVTDSSGIPVACPGTELGVGGVMTCTASGTASAGQHGSSGIVEATVEMNLGTVTDSDADYYFGYQLDLDLVKYTNGIHVANLPGPSLAAGSAVVWTYEITNNSNVILSTVTVIDDTGVEVHCPKNTLGTAEKMTCSANGKAIAGQYANTGKATGVFLQDQIEVEDSSYYYGIPTRLFIYLPILFH